MKRILTLLLMVTMCTSCAALPAEEKAFAVVLCVEKAGDAIRVYGRIPTYRSGDGYLTVTGQGASVEAALAAMESASPMDVHLSQLRLLAVDEALGRAGELPAVLLALSQREDMRLQAAVAITREPADTLMKAFEPAAGARLSKAMDVLLESRKAQGTILPATLAQVIRMGERQSPVLMNILLEDGELSLSGGWPMRSDGTLTAMLSPDETALLALLIEKPTDIRLSMKGDVVRVREVSAQTWLSEDGNTASVELTLTAVDFPLSEEELRRALAEALLSLLSRLSSDGCDVLGLGRQAVMRTHDMIQWQALNWPQKLRQLQWQVSVGVTGPA